MAKAGPGRPRKPLALKALEGTLRPDRDGHPDEQVIAQGVPEAPPHLAGEALALWGKLVPRLVEMRVAAACDAPALAMMCEWWGRYRRFSQVLDNPESGLEPQELYRTTVLCGIAQTNFDKIASKFGFTPSDRARLRVDPSTVPSRVDSRKRE